MELSKEIKRHFMKEELKKIDTTLGEPDVLEPKVKPSPVKPKPKVSPLPEEWDIQKPKVSPTPKG